jgi:glycosyltransferase involved in cell wall biosynthesis
MKILILNSNDPLRASGIVALDFFNGFKSRGHTVKMLVNQYTPAYPEDIISMETPFLILKNDLINKLNKRLKFLKIVPTDENYHFHRIKEQHSYFSIKKLLRKAKIKPDVIFVLFAKNFINSRNLFDLNRLTKAPILWLMYDMAPLTGGCHYAWDCTGYQNNCGNCPGLFSQDPFDITYENLLYRKFYTAKTNIHLIAASELQYRQALSSSLFKNKPIYKTLLSVDPAIFKPADKTEVRSKMGIPTDKKVIFFGAVYLDDKRKGMSNLLDSLHILKDMLNASDLADSIFLLVAGRGIEEITDSFRFQHKYLGYLDNTYGIASAFQAADVFLCPSIEDSGPQMVNQSMMCGTPVVSFEMGVSLDLVITGKTGYRAKLKDNKDLANGLLEILSQNNASYKKLSVNCRELALELCSPVKQFERIEEIMVKSIG